MGYFSATTSIAGLRSYQFDDLQELFARATAFEPCKYEFLSGSGYFHQAKVVDAIPLITYLSLFRITHFGPKYHRLQILSGAIYPNSGFRRLGGDLA